MYGVPSTVCNADLKGRRFDGLLSRPTNKKQMEKKHHITVRHSEIK